MTNTVSHIKSYSSILIISGLLLVALFGTAGLQAQDTIAGKTVTQKKFQRLMTKKNTVLLDVRTTEEYKSGHIPGSLQIDVLNAADFKKQVASFDKNKKYLLYCRSGKRSSSAKVLMEEMGFTKLYDLDGGFSKWTGKKEMK